MWKRNQKNKEKFFFKSINSNEKNTYLSNHWKSTKTNR